MRKMPLVSVMITFIVIFSISLSALANDNSQSTHPYIIEISPTAYPAETREKHVAGSVLLDVALSETGMITEIKIISSSGYEILDNAALDAVKKWSFNPAYAENGEAIASSLRIPIYVKPKTPTQPKTRILERSLPIYPAEAMKKHLEGTVRVGITVSKTGILTNAEIIKSSGHEILDNAALDAAKKWRFSPAYNENGEAIPFHGVFPITFQLPNTPKGTKESDDIPAVSENNQEVKK